MDEDGCERCVSACQPRVLTRGVKIPEITILNPKIANPIKALPLLTLSIETKL